MSDGIDSVIGKRGLRVLNCKYFLVTEAERKHVRRRARFQHGDASCHQVFFFLQGKEPKDIHAILTEMEHAPLYAVRNWVAQFKCGPFCTCDAPRPGQPNSVTTQRLLIRFTSKSWKTAKFWLNQ